MDVMKTSLKLVSEHHIRTCIIYDDDELYFRFSFKGSNKKWGKKCSKIHIISTKLIKIFEKYLKQ